MEPDSWGYRVQTLTELGLQTILHWTILKFMTFQIYNLQISTKRLESTLLKML